MYDDGIDKYYNIQYSEKMKLGLLFTNIFIGEQFKYPCLSNGPSSFIRILNNIFTKHRSHVTGRVHGPAVLRTTPW